MQQNVIIRPFSTSTSSHMAANQLAMALNPVVGYTRVVEDGPITKVALAFFSQDLGHDFYQVKHSCHI